MLVSGYIEGSSVLISIIGFMLVKLVSFSKLLLYDVDKSNHSSCSLKGRS